MSALEVPFVGGFVDRGVSLAEHNPVMDHLPEVIRKPLLQTIELLLDAAAFFAMSLTLGAAMFYGWPSVVGLFPHWLGVLSGGYWAYVVVILGLYAARITYVSFMSRARADVLRKDERDAALGVLAEPALLVMLIWLITTYIA